MARATELARQIATNSSAVNALIIQSIACIANMSAEDGLFTESLAAALRPGKALEHDRSVALP